LEPKKRDIETKKVNVAGTGVVVPGSHELSRDCGYLGSGEAIPMISIFGAFSRICISRDVFVFLGGGFMRNSKRGRLEKSLCGGKKCFFSSLASRFVLTTLHFEGRRDAFK